VFHTYSIKYPEDFYSAHKNFRASKGNDVSTPSRYHELPFFSRLVSNQTYSVEIPFKTAGLYRFEATFHFIA